MARKLAPRGSPTQPPPDFAGATGRHRLIECLRKQTLVANDTAIAQALQKVGELIVFRSGERIIRQGGPDNDILFIVHGEAAIFVNERQIATRLAGTHIGEMSLVDHLATRSASATALRPTVALKVSEFQFSKLARKHTDLWRRVAVEIASRLRERNRSVTQPHAQPVLFIGSSSEGLKVVEALHRILSRKRIVPRPWTDGVFEASSTTIESLVALARETDFAALVLTADDVTVSRSGKKHSPRDNVVFELGLLMGALGRDRVFILKPKQIDLRIPTDLLGVTWLEYRKTGRGTLLSKLRAPCSTMLRRINALGPK